MLKGGCMRDTMYPELSVSLVQTYIAFDYIVGVHVDVSCQAKITDLCYSSLSQEDISCSQVSVDTLKNMQNLFKDQMEHVISITINNTTFDLD